MQTLKLFLFQAMLSERELNPYWKDGGTGLPPEKEETASVKKGKRQLLVIILNFCPQSLVSLLLTSYY